MQLVLQRTEQGAWPEDWQGDYGTTDRTQEEIVRDVVNLREPATPAVWGVRPVETENYPVPADMKDWGTEPTIADSSD